MCSPLPPPLTTKKVSSTKMGICFDVSPFLANVGAIC